MRILALITDAFGGHGGIALYNRDVLSALCSKPEVSKVVAIPRVIINPLEPLPDILEYEIAATKSKFSYIRTIIRIIYKYKNFDIILCGHINLMPIAWTLGKIMGIPVVLEIYGIDAWQPTKRWLANQVSDKADVVISISNYTKERFIKWTNLSEGDCKLLPNAIHLENYGEEKKSQELLNRYDLNNKKVILTLGRIVSKERAKGFDEILDVLPDIAKKIPNISYVIAGDGNYRPELEKKVQELGLQDSVVFTGMIKEEEKADLYRLADVFVMPSRGEGFGFVFLEAMACGIPAIASKVDGSREAVRDGRLGHIVDPDNSNEIKNAIYKALETKKSIPKGIEYFSYENFTLRLHKIIDSVLRKKYG